jgi:hypothetical protein
VRRRARAAQVQAAIDEHAARLGVTRGEVGQVFVPDQGNRDAAAPYWGLDGPGYFYAAQERGRELFRRTTRELDELLEWVMSDITWSLASRYELAHRVPGRDFRRLMFATWVELATGLDPAWGAHVQAYVDETLARSPYDDSLG